MAWVQQTSGTVQSLNHCYGFSALDVYAVGNAGTILHWDGTAWTSQTSGTVRNLQKVWGAAPNAVWVAGSNGTLLLSSDGGTTWTQVNSLNTAVGFSGAYAGIWGSSVTDFWVVEQTNGGFWHTKDGGNTWTLVATSAHTWSHLWGTGANAIYAVANDLFLGYWNGTTWSIVADTVNTDSNLGIWPFGTRVYVAGADVAAPQAPAIGDWTTTLSSGVGDTIVTPPDGFVRFVFGADLVNLYASGRDSSNVPKVWQISQPPGTPSTPGSWAQVTLPGGLPAGGFRAHWADGSGFVVAVGQVGLIVANLGTALSLSSALAIGTNAIQVNTSVEPLDVSASGVGDALNPDTWTVTRSDTGFEFTVTSVTQNSATQFVLTLLEAMGSQFVTHQITAPTMVRKDKQPIAASSSASCGGMLSDKTVNTDAIAAARNFSVSDVANPATPTLTSPGGTMTIVGGDYASVSADELTKKLIHRRLSTKLNGFFHLRGYGLGIDPKEPVPATDIPKLQVQVKQQVLLEDVRSATVTVRMQSDPGILFIAWSAVSKQTGRPIEGSLRFPPTASGG